MSSDGLNVLGDCGDGELLPILNPVTELGEGEIARIADLFAIEGEFVGAEEIETGLINATWVVSYRSPRDEKGRYILQRINESVFGHPLEVMQNVEVVTRHINDKVLRAKESLRGRTLSLYPSRTGASCVEGAGGGVWRCYNFIEGCRTYDVVTTPQQAYQAGRAFGDFQALVSDLPASELVEVIPDFHNTPQRYQQLRQAVREDAEGLAETVADELARIEAMVPEMGHIVQLAETGQLPLRVTHNDTKINNVLFDLETDEAVCVIDLDTVMPGLSLYDIGDLIRTSVNPAAEDERDLSLVKVRMPIFEALMEGYLASVGDVLTPQESEILTYSGKLLALELSMRFLTDYLTGDHYFKTTRSGQNLDRARTQLKLAEEMTRAEDVLAGYVKRLLDS